MANNNYEKVASAADRLREAMADAGKKQADLARETGLDTGLISRYVAGTYEPKAHAAGKLARALGVSEMWLFGYDVPKNRTAEQKTNDQLVPLIVRLRSDKKLLETVLALAELSEEQLDAVVPLLGALRK